MGTGARIRGRAEFEKQGEGPLVGPLKGALVTMQKIEDAGVVGQMAKGEGGEDGCRSGGRVLARHLHLKTGGLDSPHAQLTPVGDGHGMDQLGFGGIAGMELEVESSEELVEGPDGFALEDNGAGEKVVAGRVPRGDALAFGRDWSGGFCGVGAISLDLTFSCHDGPRVRGWMRRGGWVETRRG